MIARATDAVATIAFGAIQILVGAMDQVVEAVTGLR